MLLLVMLSFQDNKNTKLTVENGLMKGRLETMQERIAEKESLSPNGPLTVDGIEEAIRHAGYVPDVKENWIRFIKKRIDRDLGKRNTGRLMQRN